MEKLNLLIIEGDPTALELLKGYLVKKNTTFFALSMFEIHSVPTIYEALVAVKERTVDLALLDLDLPDFPPAGAIRVIHKIVPQLPIVVLSSKTDEDFALHMIEVGAQDFLVKDVLTRHRLLTAIYFAMERQRTDKAWRKSEARFRASVENMVEGFAILKPVSTDGGKIVDFVYDYINEAGCKLDFTTQEQLIGKRLLDFLPNYRTSGMFDDYVRVVETGKPLMKQITNYNDTWAGHSLNRSLDVRALKLEEGLAVLWRDITEQSNYIEQTRIQAEQMAALYQTSLEITSRLDLNTLVLSIVERAAKLTESSMGSLFLTTGDGYLKLVGGYQIPMDLVGTCVPAGAGLAGKAMQTGQAQWVADYQAVPENDSLPYPEKYRRMLAVPLIIQGTPTGVISIADLQSTQPFREDQVRLVKLFADQAAIAIENGRLYSNVQQLSLMDDLTGVYNRRALFQLGKREVERSLRYSHPLTAIMLDIDHFKELNDQFGHLAGDEVLKCLVSRIRRHVREVDILARYGGDEFVLLLTESGLTGALQVAERVRKAITDTPCDAEQGTIPLSVSVGVSDLQPETRDLTDLLEMADRALYQAKRAGRNCVMRAN